LAMAKISNKEIYPERVPVPSGAYWVVTDPTDNNKTVTISVDAVLTAAGGRMLIHTPEEDTNVIQDSALIGAQSVYKIEASNQVFTDPQNDAASFPDFALDSEEGTITISQNYFYANTKYIIYIIYGEQQ
ncbi:MAG TPA: hypothetical protein VEA37_00725, partial [Flavobacterium sp.]|nr:hypothetical protein [Flavobacterium sp.]